MRFKVDENLPIEVADLLTAAGHDAATVNDQGAAVRRTPISLAWCGARNGYW
jgi:predicted nuclease of predicted toxin-antitoxin system